MGPDDAGGIHKIYIDVYSIQRSLSQSPPIAHTFKKLWSAGQRSGGKTYLQDLEECIWQLNIEIDFIKNGGLNDGSQEKEI